MIRKKCEYSLSDADYRLNYQVVAENMCNENYPFCNNGFCDIDSSNIVKNINEKNEIKEKLKNFGMTRVKMMII